MNMFLRLFWLMLIGRLRRPCPPLGPCRTPFWVIPTDLDILRHMNNGVYFSILDLARIDLMQRSGVAKQITERGWYPVVVSETIQFRKSLQLFDRFVVETVILGWDDKAFLLEQTFIRKNEALASAIIRARFLKRSGGSVLPTELLALTGVSTNSPELPEWVARWNADQIALLKNRV
jgi:acyl-CoA thioesterase FadM